MHYLFILLVAVTPLAIAPGFPFYFDVVPKNCSPALRRCTFAPHLRVYAICIRLCQGSLWRSGCGTESQRGKNSKVGSPLAPILRSQKLGI
jgi:hypothetical protein